MGGARPKAWFVRSAAALRGIDVLPAVPVLVYLATLAWIAAPFGREAVFDDVIGFVNHEFVRARSFAELLFYFDREPVGFVLYVKALDGLRTDLFATLAAGNAVFACVSLYLGYVLVERFASRWVALAAMTFVAAGLEFPLYTLFTRYEILTAFAVTVWLAVHAAIMENPGGDLKRVWVLPAVALAPALIRSFYGPAFWLYAAYLLIVSWAHRRTGRVRRLVAATAVCASIFLAFAVRNWVLYDYFATSAMQFQNAQTNVAEAVQRLGLFEAEDDLRRFIASSPWIPAETREFFAKGAPWPVVVPREGFDAWAGDSAWGGMLERPGGSTAYARSWAGGRHGDRMGVALRHGYRVARAIVLAHPLAVVGNILRASRPVASGYSTLWFLDHFGSAYLGSTTDGVTFRGPGYFWRNLHESRDQRMLYGSEKLLRRYLTPVTKPLLWAHLVFNAYGIVLLVVAALAIVARSIVRAARGRRVDHVLLFAAGLVAYSFAVSCAGGWPENARYTIYWKIPAVFLAAALGARGARRARRALRERKRPVEAASRLPAAARFPKVFVGHDSYERHRWTVRLLGKTKPGETLIDIGGEGLLPLFAKDLAITSANVVGPTAMDLSTLEEDAFDYAVSIDTLEHIPKEERRAHLELLLRVARNRVVFCAPIGTPMQVELQKKMLSSPAIDDVSRTFVREHLDYGMPTPEEVEALLPGVQVEWWYSGSVKFYEPPKKVPASRFGQRILGIVGLALNFSANLIWTPVKVGRRKKPQTNRFYGVIDLSREDEAFGYNRPAGRRADSNEQ